jgi:hypothetical protein
MPEDRLSIRAPVIREGAQNYLLLSLVSFGGSVVFTRLFLQLTGYPKLGNGELHIAHVLWGGLLLFIASLLPLIYANRWVYPLGAFLSGIGVGLFIDEVGKFITQSNDYFYPPAAPIIYAVFLLTVLVYLRIRKKPDQDKRNIRNEFYSVLEGITEVLDRDLEPAEQTELRQRLLYIASSAQEEDLAHLAGQLAEFIASEKIYIAPDRPTYVRKAMAAARSAEKRLLNRRRLRITLILALTIVGVVALVEVLTALTPASRLTFNFEALILGGMTRGEIRSAIGIFWFFVHLALQAITALMAIFSAGLIVSGREKRGVDLGIVVIVVSLTMVTLLTFFIDQFSATINALIQLLVFLALTYYRRRYLV